MKILKMCCLYFFICLNLWLVYPAKADRLITDLSNNKIIVHSNFTGTHIFLFGSVDYSNTKQKNMENDIIIVLRGPSEEFIIRRKDNIAGIWINAEHRNVTKIPAYYALFSSRDFNEIATTETLKKYNIGLNYKSVNVKPQFVSQLAEDNNTYNFQEAFLRLQKDNGRYHRQPNSITKVNDTLFHVRINLPNDVPKGEYFVDTYLFRKGVLINRSEQKISIEKSGVQKLLFFISRQHPLLYGVVSLIISLSVGILIGVVFARRKH